MGGLVVCSVGGNCGSAASLCFHQESPGGAFMSSADSSTKNPQSSTSVSSSVGGVVMRVRRREGCWP
jgi:hypothetical protein